jgi:uncharacterized protein (TIGR03437 family)
MNRAAIAAVVAALFLVPALLRASASGPEPGVSGAPGETTCTRCHAGTPNPPIGSIRAAAQGGSGFVAGIAKRIRIDIDVSAVDYGFQATARLASAVRTTAGTFRPVGLTRVQCSDRDFVTWQFRDTGVCPPSMPLEYVQHAGPSRDPFFEFDWIPGTDVNEDVIIYIAVNAVNGDNGRTGDRVFTTRLALSPLSRPAVTSQGVAMPVNFGAGRVLGTQSWIEIYGQGFGGSRRDWTGLIENGQAPTVMDGISVLIGGRPAALSFVSGDQINAQVPDGLGAGAVPLVVRNAAGESAPVTVQIAPTTPSWLAPPSFRVNGRQYAAALHADGAFAGPPNLVSGVPFRPAAPGDRLLLYGLGFGATEPPQQAGRLVREPNRVRDLVLLLDGTPVRTEYAGLAPGLTGLYQFNIIVPELPPGDYEVRGSVGGVPLPVGHYLTLRR